MRKDWLFLKQLRITKNICVSNELKGEKKFSLFFCAKQQKKSDILNKKQKGAAIFEFSAEGIVYEKSFANCRKTKLYARDKSCLRKT